MSAEGWEIVREEDYKIIHVVMRPKLRITSRHLFRDEGVFHRLNFEPEAGALRVLSWHIDDQSVIAEEVLDSQAERPPLAMFGRSAHGCAMNLPFAAGQTMKIVLLNDTEREIDLRLRAKVTLRKPPIVRAALS